MGDGTASERIMICLGAIDREIPTTIDRVSPASIPPLRGGGVIKKTTIPGKRDREV